MKIRKGLKQTTVIPKEPSGSGTKKRTFKEKKELEQLTTEIEMLEKEKAELELLLSTGTLKTEDLIVKSNRIGEVIALIDQKTDRWLELSE